MNNRRKPDPKGICRSLKEEKHNILELSAARAEERRPVELDQQSVGRLSRMDAMQIQAMAQALEVRRQGRLQLIDAALRRLEDGDYGYCVNCGEKIPVGRLSIDPTISRCIDCAQ